MTTVTVRDAKRGDMKEVRRLIQELADFERMPNGPEIDEKTLEHDAFDLEHPLFHCYVVDHPSDSSKLVGYAIYYYTYGTWTGRKMYLEDIYVTEAFRGKNVGNALFKQVVQKGVEMNCINMDFIVLNWNPAQDFYKARGCVDITKEEEWHLFRMSTANMKKLVAKN